MTDLNLVVFLFVVVFFEVFRIELLHWCFSGESIQQLRVQLSSNVSTLNGNHTQVVGVIDALNQSRHNPSHSSVKADLLFAVHYVSVHLQPNIDCIFVINVLVHWWSHEGPLVYTSNEYSLVMYRDNVPMVCQASPRNSLNIVLSTQNTIAGALYGRWIALPLCWSMALMACVFSYTIVRFSTWLLVDVRSIHDPQALDHDDIHIGHRIVMPQHRTQREHLQANELNHRIRRFLFGRKLLLLTVVRLIPVVPNWLQNIVNPLSDVSLSLILCSLALGQLPYLWYCVEIGLKMVEESSDAPYTSETFEHIATQPLAVSIAIALAILLMLFSLDYCQWNCVQRWLAQMQVH